MATTYELIAKSVLGSDAADVTLTSVPSTFDDVLLVASTRCVRAGNLVDGLRVEFNGDTGSNYSGRYLYGDGSIAVSGVTATTYVYFGLIPGSTSTSNTFSNASLLIPNYAGSTNKSVSVTSSHESNGSTAYNWVSAHLWSDTSAITSIRAFAGSGGNLVSGSSFYLYGITKA